MPLRFISGGASNRPTPVAAVYTLRHDSAAFAVHKSECEATLPRGGPPPSHVQLSSLLSARSALCGEGVTGIAPLCAPGLSCRAAFSPPVAGAPLSPPEPRSPAVSTVPLPLRHRERPLRAVFSKALRTAAAPQRRVAWGAAAGTWAELSAAAASWAAASRSGPARQAPEPTPPPPRPPASASLEWLFATQEAKECGAGIEFHATARPYREPLRDWRRRTPVPHTALPESPAAHVLRGLGPSGLCASGCCRADAEPMLCVPVPTVPTAPRAFPLETAPHAKEFLPLMIPAPRPLRSAPALRRTHEASRSWQLQPHCAVTALPVTAELRFPRGARTHLALALRNAAANKLPALRREQSRTTLRHFCRRPHVPAGVAAVSLSIPPPTPLRSAADAENAFTAEFCVLLRPCAQLSPPAVPDTAGAVIHWASQLSWVPLSEDSEASEWGGVFPRDVELHSLAGFRRRSGGGLQEVFLDDLATMPHTVRDAPGVVEDAQLHYCYRLAFEQAKERLGIQ